MKARESNSASCEAGGQSALPQARCCPGPGQPSVAGEGPTAGGILSHQPQHRQAEPGRRFGQAAPQIIGDSGSQRLRNHIYICDGFTRVRGRESDPGARAFQVAIDQNARKAEGYYSFRESQQQAPRPLQRGDAVGEGPAPAEAVKRTDGQRYPGNRSLNSWNIQHGSVSIHLAHFFQGWNPSLYFSG